MRPGGRNRREMVRFIGVPLNQFSKCFPLGQLPKLVEPNKVLLLLCHSPFDFARIRDDVIVRLPVNFRVMQHTYTSVSMCTLYPYQKLGAYVR
jgi:hypothetical protein